MNFAGFFIGWLVFIAAMVVSAFDLQCSEVTDKNFSIQVQVNKCEVKLNVFEEFLGFVSKIKSKCLTIKKQT